MCETLQEIVDLMQEIKQKRTIVRCSERVSDCLLLAKDIAEASTTNTINFSRTWAVKLQRWLLKLRVWKSKNSKDPQGRDQQRHVRDQYPAWATSVLHATAQSISSCVIYHTLQAANHDNLPPNRLWRPQTSQDDDRRRQNCSNDVLICCRSAQICVTCAFKTSNSRQTRSYNDEDSDVRCDKGKQFSS